MAWLEKIPWPALVLVAAIVAVMPLGEPHLVQKWRMLFSGTLRRPLDWFDLTMHTAPLLLVVLKFALTRRHE